MTTDSITSPSKGLRVQHAGPVLHAELASPHTGNALNADTLDDLLRLLTAVRQQPDPGRPPGP